MSTREKIDRILSKWISRKLTVFIVATTGLFSGNLTSTDWVIIATTYIMVEGATDAVERLFKARGVV